MGVPWHPQYPQGRQACVRIRKFRKELVSVLQFQLESYIYFAYKTQSLDHQRTFESRSQLHFLFVIVHSVFILLILAIMYAEAMINGLMTKPLTTNYSSNQKNQIFKFLKVKVNTLIEFRILQKFLSVGHYHLEVQAN